MDTESMGGTSCSSSSTLTKFYKYPLDNILLNLIWETILLVLFDIRPSHSISNSLGNWNLTTLFQQSTVSVTLMAQLHTQNNITLKHG